MAKGMAKGPTWKGCDPRRGRIQLPLLTFFIGVTLGLLMSPIKQGIGNNSGNSTNHYYGKDEPLEEVH